MSLLKIQVLYLFLIQELGGCTIVVWDRFCPNSEDNNLRIEKEQETCRSAGEGDTRTEETNLKPEGCQDPTLDDDTYAASLSGIDFEQAGKDADDRISKKFEIGDIPSQDKQSQGDDVESPIDVLTEKNSVVDCTQISPTSQIQNPAAEENDTIVMPGVRKSEPCPPQVHLSSNVSNQSDGAVARNLDLNIDPPQALSSLIVQDQYGVQDTQVPHPKHYLH